MPQENAGPRRRGSRRAALLDNISYEVMPFAHTDRAVAAVVPTTVPLTVTVTEAKGIEATVALAKRLVERGYRVAPHLPARQFVSVEHVADVVARLRQAEVDSVFVIGGDAPTPAGPFGDAQALLQALEAAEHPFDWVGIAGYPEGHASIPQESLDLAVKRKTAWATHVVSQICFDAATTSAWAAGMAASGVELPIDVGLPGPVRRQKLMRIAGGIGLGQSARFLQKQRSLLWRFLLPGGYNPTSLLNRLAAAQCGSASPIRGVHLFTFNEFAKAEAWRCRLLDSVAEPGERS